MTKTDPELERLLRAIKPELQERVKTLVEEPLRGSVVRQTLYDALLERDKLLALDPEEARRRLLTALRHNAFDRGRVEARRRAREVAVDDGPDQSSTDGGPRLQLAAAGPSPEEQRLQEEVRDAFWAAVRALPARERQVFELHKWERIPLTQVAVQLGITRDEARGALARAVDMLEAVLPPEVRR